MRSSMITKYEIKFGFVKAREWVSSKTEEYFHKEQAMRRYCELKKKIEVLENKLTSEQKYYLLHCAEPKCFVNIFWKEEDNSEWNRSISSEMQFFFEASIRLEAMQIEDNVSLVDFGIAI